MGAVGIPVGNSVLSCDDMLSRSDNLAIVGVNPGSSSGLLLHKLVNHFDSLQPLRLSIGSCLNQVMCFASFEFLLHQTVSLASFGSCLACRHSDCLVCRFATSHSVIFFLIVRFVVCLIVSTSADNDWMPKLVACKKKRVF